MLELNLFINCWNFPKSKQQHMPWLLFDSPKEINLSWNIKRENFNYIAYFVSIMILGILYHIYSFESKCSLKANVVESLGILNWCKEFAYGLIRKEFWVNTIMQWFSKCNLGISEVPEILEGNMQDQEFFFFVIMLRYYLTFFTLILSRMCSKVFQRLHDTWWHNRLNANTNMRS